MLFYASLFVVCTIAACILLWMFRSLREVGTAVYRAFLPSGRGNVKAERLTHLSSHLDSTPTPWGWGSSNSPVRAEPHRLAEPVRDDAPVPWGWRGNKHNKVAPRATNSGNSYLDKVHFNDMIDKVRSTVGVADVSEENSRVGWPYREESFDFSGSKYKYSRKPEARKSSTSKNAKPWGW